MGTSHDFLTFFWPQPDLHVKWLKRHVFTQGCDFCSTNWYFLYLLYKVKIWREKYELGKFLLRFAFNVRGPEREHSLVFIGAVQLSFFTEFYANCHTFCGVLVGQKQHGFHAPIGMFETAKCLMMCVCIYVVTHYVVVVQLSSSHHEAATLTPMTRHWFKALSQSTTICWCSVRRRTGWRIRYATQPPVVCSRLKSIDTATSSVLTS